MKVDEFIEETSNIEKYYGKELEDYQRKIWYQELQNLSIARYRQIIRELYRKCKFMPKLADILEIHTNLSYERQVEQNTEKVECEKCKGLGFVLYTKMFDNGIDKIPYQYIARCTCKNGENYIYDGRNVQDKRFRTNYYIPSVAEIGI